MTALSLHAWLDHQWPAVAIIAAILIPWAILASIPVAVLIGRMIAGCDHDHAADHAAMPLGTLLPGPSETPVHDRCAAIFGVVPEVRS